MGQKDKAYKPIVNFCITLHHLPAITNYSDAVYFLKPAFLFSCKNR